MACWRYMFRSTPCLDTTSMLGPLALNAVCSLSRGLIGADGSYMSLADGDRVLRRRQIKWSHEIMRGAALRAAARKRNVDSMGSRLAELPWPPGTACPLECKPVQSTLGARQLYLCLRRLPYLVHGSSTAAATDQPSAPRIPQCCTARRSQEIEFICLLSMPAVTAYLCEWHLHGQPCCHKSKGSSKPGAANRLKTPDASKRVRHRTSDLAASRSAGACGLLPLSLS